MMQHIIRYSWTKKDQNITIVAKCGCCKYEIITSLYVTQLYDPFGISLTICIAIENLKNDFLSVQCVEAEKK